MSKLFKRPCIKCGKVFQPTGKFSKQCDKCRYKHNHNKDQLKKFYFKNKEDLDKLRDDITLKKWRILSKAYKQGKKIWKTKFTREKLSKYMDIPYTTTLRCLSLNRANKNSWELVKQGKLSVFKLAMICQSKSRTYQDEIVNLVIEDNLSTYQIKTLKVNNLKDINLERHRLAVENGYSRKNSAYFHFRRWAERGKIFLLMDKSYLPESKMDDIEERLKKLKEDIGKYLE